MKCRDAYSLCTQNHPELYNPWTTLLGVKVYFNGKRVVWCYGFHNYIAQEFILFKHIKLRGGDWGRTFKGHSTPGMELFEQQYLTEQYIILTSKLNLNFSLQNSCTPHVLKFNDIRTANVHNRPRFGIYFKHLCTFISVKMKNVVLCAIYLYL